MNTSENFIDEEVEVNPERRTTDAMIDFASVLDDYLDEEVVDKEGIIIGSLACYWQSVSGRLVFLGVKLKEDQSVRIVPGHRSQVDERESCIRLGFDVEDVESAPHFDCAKELDKHLERVVYEHFRVAEAQPHGGLRHVAHPLKKVGDTACQSSAAGCALPKLEVPSEKAELISETIIPPENKHTAMNKLEIKGDWNIIKGKLTQKWAQLTHDDLQFIEGKEEELIGRIQKRTGEARENVEKALHESCGCSTN